MKYNLIVTSVAEEHIVNACYYYEEQQPGLSARFLAELNSVYNKLSSDPLNYSYISSNPVDKFRDVKLYRFPFVVIYEVAGDDVIVMAVFIQAESPIYFDL